MNLTELKFDLTRLKAQLLLAKGNWGHKGRPGMRGGSSGGGGVSKRVDLTEEERFTIDSYINDYVDAGWEDINSILAQGKELTEVEMDQVKQLRNTLDTIVSYQGEVYRRINVSDKKAQELMERYNSSIGKEIKIPQFLPCTKLQESLVDFPGNVTYTIQSKNGVDLSKVAKKEFRHEVEVLFKNNSQFRIKGAGKAKEGVTLFLEEV